MGREIREMERDSGTQTKAGLAGEVQSQTQGDGEGQAEKDLKRGRLGRGGGTVGREWGMAEMETGAGGGGRGGVRAPTKRSLLKASVLSPVKPQLS